VDGKPVRTVSDLTVTPGHGPEVLAEADTVIIPGYAITQASAAATDSKALDALSSVRPGTRLVSICSGAFLLAGAGSPRWASGHHPLGAQRPLPGTVSPGRARRRRSFRRPGRPPLRRAAVPGRRAGTVHPRR
jgi:hypothetical protein